MYRTIIRSTPAGLILALAASSGVDAANEEFQNLLINVCSTPSGTLVTRCAETPGGAGNISGDSESSLNPSQTLSNNDVSLSVARSRSKEARERGEQLRDGEQSNPAAVAIGPFSLLIHGRAEQFDSDRAVNADNIDRERGLDGDTWAAELGFDYRFSDRAVAGAIFTYAQSEADFDAELPGVNFTPAATAGDIEADSWSITVFGSYNFSEHFFLESGLGFGMSDYSFRRNSVFQETNRTVAQTNARNSGDADGTDFWTSLNLGYNLNSGGFSFGPYAGFTFASSDIDSYTETDLSGAGLNMRVSGTDRSSTISHLGVRGSYAIKSASGVWLPQLRVEYNHEFDRDAESVTTSFVLDTGNNQLSQRGDEPDRNFFDVSLGLVAILPNGWMPFIDYETLVGDDDLDRNRITAGLRVSF